MAGDNRPTRGPSYTLGVSIRGSQGSEDTHRGVSVHLGPTPFREGPRRSERRTLDVLGLWYGRAMGVLGLWYGCAMGQLAL
eukprot:3777155-Pyramimonas_sp.AAC.2